MAVTVKITSITQNKLLNRKELELQLIHTNAASPKKSDVTAQLAKLYSKNEKNVIVYDLKTKFGTFCTRALAKVYDSWDDLATIERQFVVERKTGKKMPKVLRRARKDIKKKKAKMFGTLRRNMKKSEKRNK